MLIRRERRAREEVEGGMLRTPRGVGGVSGEWIWLYFVVYMCEICKE